MICRSLAVAFVVLISVGTAASQKVMPSTEQVTIKHIAHEIPIDQLDHAAWKNASPVKVGTYWSGEAAPDARAFEARLLWSDTALYVRFDAVQGEPLVVSPKPDLSKKVVGLWDRDVCEIFIAPDKNDANKYFEFEIAPTGEWIDLAIEATPKGRKTDLEYRSGMASAARIENGRVIMAIRIPFTALGATPKNGAVWLGNLFRCVGSGPTRGYLAWRPTKTPRPNFHVPTAFAKLRFKK